MQTFNFVLRISSDARSDDGQATESRCLQVLNSVFCIFLSIAIILCDTKWSVLIRKISSAK